MPGPGRSHSAPRARRSSIRSSRAGTRRARASAVASASAAYVHAPAPHVVAAGDDAGADALRDPRLDDEVADLGLDAEQVAGPHAAEALGVTGVEPERVRVRDLVQPLRVGAPGVDLHREPEG